MMALGVDITESYLEKKCESIGVKKSCAFQLGTVDVVAWSRTSPAWWRPLV